MILLTTIDPEAIGWCSAIIALGLLAVLAIFGGGMNNEREDAEED